MRSKISLKEIIITACIIIACISALLAYKLAGIRGNYAVISINSEIICEKELSHKNSGEFAVEQVPGVMFEIKDGRIRVISSDCPDKICVHTGFISETDEKIICMPKKLVIEILNK